MNCSTSTGVAPVFDRRPFAWTYTVCIWVCWTICLFVILGFSFVGENRVQKAQEGVICDLFGCWLPVFRASAPRPPPAPSLGEVG